MSIFVLQGSDPSLNRRINYHTELNQEQLDVVLHGDGPCLVLAGAGSGKTRTVTYRVAYLLEQGTDPSQILLLTFTNKASKEMLQRVNLLLGDETRGLWGGTFHSIGNRMLRAFAEELGYTSSFTIFDQDDGQSLLKAIMKDRNIDPKAQRFPTASVLQNIISYSRNTLRSIDEALEEKHPSFVNFAGEIGDIARDYANRKQSANAMDFDDLLVNWLRLLQHATIGEHLRSQFRFILVDEYQDTNAIQASIVMEMAKVHKNVVVVGDDAQSIYAFRGADVHNILDFPHVFPETKIFKLVTNYRSVPQILDVANESLLHNSKQFQKELIAVLPKGTKPNIIACASTRQEAQYIAEQIVALRAEGIALTNMAVLFRSSAHSQVLEFELIKRDIPYEYRGGMKFFERAHIKDVICFIRVIQNTADEAAWLRILGLQTGIGATTAGSITKEVKRAGDIQTIVKNTIMIRLSARARDGWNECVEILRNITNRSSRPSDILKGVIESTYQEYLEREYPDWRDRLEDLEQLVLFAESYQDPTTFLADIALYDDVIGGRSNQSVSGNERMVLSTIHQAKGLEWDTVFILHLADGSFPSKRSLGERDGLEEERRLFYVAVTRARRRLFLSYPITSGFDTLVLNQPSLFLEEIPKTLMERIELREARSTGLSKGFFMNQKNSHKQRDMLNDEDRTDWSWDEPTISIDDQGERSIRSTPSSTVWKKKM
ncbi:ATP-dependent helicase [Candidatus Uhrbacteria bacterium]|nr:ATP-dependent helicase [Candidatus Uhrbacteria bacterium]